MNKVRWLFGSVIDDVTLTATSEALSVDNLQKTGPKKVWRSTDLADQTITAPFSASTDVDVIHLENINTDQPIVVQFSDDNFSTIKHAEMFSAWADDLTYKSATLWLTGTSGGGMFLDGGGDSVADSGGDTVISGAYNNALPISATYMRLIISDSANADGYLEIGRWMAGKYYVATNSENVSVNKLFDYRERARLVETRGGSFRSEQRTPQRKAAVEYQFLHEDDATEIATDSLAEYVRTVGHRQDVLMSVYPDESTDRESLHTIVGRITQRSGIQGQVLASDNGNIKLYSSMSFEITEAL